VRKPRVIPDEDHEVVYERVAAVDVAKASGVVCMRLPDPARPGRYSNQIWDNVPAARARITELGRELLRHQVQMVTLESTSVIRGRQQASATAGDRPALSVSPSVADGLSAGPSATQIADCGAHLAPTSRRCRFCLPAADASATARPAQCPIFGF
jgi:hypothetical protein